MPSKFDLRNVNGKNYVTPNKNQGKEGLCWAYATASLLETHDLIAKSKSYDSSATLFSEKQMDYALSSDGIVGGNNVVRASRKLSDGGYLDEPGKLLAERLSGFQDTWNVENSSAISNNEELEPYIVFDREKSLYEVDETLLLTNVNSDISNQELNESMINTLKNIVYNNGGVTVNIKSSNSNIIRNYINGDYLAITSVEYFTENSNQHALHLIGWDDDYEYGFCSGDRGGDHGKFVSGNAYYHADHECGTWGNTSVSYEYVKVTGQGAWILKNSWGNDYSYVYLPYDSFINDVFSITKYSEKNWDHSTHLISQYEYGASSFKYNYSAENDLIDGDTVVKLKININSPRTISLYYSENGDKNNLNLVGNYNFDSAGIKTIDLSDKNLHIYSDSYFQLDASYNITLFTERNNNSVMAYTDEYVYSIENEKPSNDRCLSIPIMTKLRNVEDSEIINYKIRNSNGTYLPTSAYSIISNKSYYDIVTPIIKISEQYAKNGTYTLETWKNDLLLYSSSIYLDADYISVDGSGTNNDPWLIKNVRQFNMMRNAPSDNFLLMNDLDFGYDTQNENGLFYNSGNGWKAINFQGNFDGNNKTVRNIKASEGFFESFYAYGDCPYDKCGIHDLNVDNISIYNCGQATGGIINYINVLDTYSHDFSNLSLTNSHIYADKNLFSSSNNSYIYVGGIVGRMSVYGISGLKITTVKNDNWYSDYEYNVATEIRYATRDYIGGLVGYIITYRMPFLSFNNAKSNMNVNLNYGNNIDFYVSDVIGAIKELNAHINVNNTIGIVNVNSASGIGVEKNAFIGQMIDDDISGDVSINGTKSTLNYTPNNLVNIANYEAGLEPYELARANYDNIAYYENNNFAYNEYRDGTTKVNFTDKFNTFEDKIPILKAHPENYSTYYKNYSIEVEETKTIEDLILNDTHYRKLKVYSSFDCDLDVCNNITDETIITIPTEENGYTFKGLNGGITTLIIYDELSGYLDTVSITVLGDDTLKNILENDGYIVNANYVSKFVLGDTISSIKDKLGNDVIIETDKSIISTGAIIKKSSESYTVVIKGDLNGDGRVNSADLLQMRKHLLEEVNLTGAYKEAGIIESVGNIKSLDLLRIRQYLLDEYVFR